MEAKSKLEWIIPDMYWPEITSGEHYVSHESICVLNTGSEDCAINITLYFEDAEPMPLQSVLCAARRTHHIRMDKILDLKGKHIPQGVPYAATVACSIPVSVQYTRVDTTQSANAIMTTMAL